MKQDALPEPHRRMTEKRPDPPLDARDFDAIQAAVMETERGRWFLGEFARRNRLGETSVLLDAIGRLEQNIGGPRPADETDLVRAGIARISDSLARALAEVATAGDGGGGAAPFESFARSATLMQTATSDIHDAAERVGETAWRLREAGVSAALCDGLEAAAAEISTACAYGGLTAARAAALAEALASIEGALAALPPSWRPASSPVGRAPTPAAVASSGAPEASPHRVEPPGPRKAKPAPAPLPKPVPEPPPAAAEPPAPLSPEPRRMPGPSLAAIDALDFRERLKLFT